LTDDADIWTLARAVQLLTSKDKLVRGIFSEQLKSTILPAFPNHPPATLPIAEYLSASNEAGLYRLRFGEAGTNLWTLARRAAKNLGARIDISDDQTLRIIVDDVSVIPAKAVRGLRHVVRKKHTTEITLINTQEELLKPWQWTKFRKTLPASPLAGLNFGMLTGNSSTLLGWTSCHFVDIPI
jgi:hypothetical protein